MNDKLFFVMRMRFYCIIVILYREEIMLKCQIHNAKNVKTGFTQVRHFLNMLQQINPLIYNIICLLQ